MKRNYVLATKYSDGDPRDQWCIGFPVAQRGDRFLVTDTNGNLFRNAGFRRIKKISKQRGDFILRNRENIERGSKSLWWWVRCSMKEMSAIGGGSAN